MGALGGPGGIADGASQAEAANTGRTAAQVTSAGSVRRSLAVVVISLITLAVVLPPLFTWQSENQRKALSLSNMRRVAAGALIYAQDWDQRLPPPLVRMPDGFMLAWPRQVRPYVLKDDAFTNPSNPVQPFPPDPVLRDPVDGHAIDTSYALNGRFWNRFGPGPFPVGNLEMPEQTALVVEAGRMAADPRRPRIAGAGPGLARDLYGDTTDRVSGLSPYPTTHGDQSAIVAADGHGVAAKILYYGPKDGPHDVMFGRVGDGIYNWNGGHPNGETDTPTRE
jgi:hypothetical protein